MVETPLLQRLKLLLLLSQKVLLQMVDSTKSSQKKSPLNFGFAAGFEAADLMAVDSAVVAVAVAVAGVVVAGVAVAGVVVDDSAWGLQKR